MTFYKYIMFSLRLIDDDNKIRAGGRIRKLTLTQATIHNLS